MFGNTSFTVRIPKINTVGHSQYIGDIGAQSAILATVTPLSSNSISSYSKNNRAPLLIYQKALQKRVRLKTYTGKPTRLHCPTMPGASPTPSFVLLQVRPWPK